MDPGCPPYDPNCPYKDESILLGQVTTSPGEWNVYVDAAGVWTAVDAERAARPRTARRSAPSRRIDLYVPKGKPWRLFVQTRECDFGSLGNAYSVQGSVAPCPHINEVGNTVSDDRPGIVAVHFRSPQASIGTHRVNSSLDGSTCPASNMQGLLPADVHDFSNPAIIRAMATNPTDNKDLVSRLKDAGEDAMQKLGDVPGGKKALEALNGLRDRIDDLQKRMKRIDELEKRVEALEEGRARSRPRASGRRALRVRLRSRPKTNS